jgi:hypothetical protein
MWKINFVEKSVSIYRPQTAGEAYHRVWSPSIVSMLSLDQMDLIIMNFS